MENQRIELPVDQPSLPDEPSHLGEIKQSETRTPEPAPTTTSIESRLQAWVKSVEKDTQTQVQDYLEQIDAGQSGE